MSNTQSPQSTCGPHRLLLLPSVNNNTSPQTLAIVEALRDDGFEVDVAEAETEAIKLLRKASKTQQPYPLAILGLGMSPVNEDLEKIKRIWNNSSTTFVVTCAAEYSQAWENKLRKLVQRGQIILLDNPVDTLMLRRLANSLVANWQKADAMRRKLERMINTVSACAHEISQRQEAEEEASSYATKVEATNKALEKICEAAEAAAAAKTEFLANMSHEIRTPMTAMLGYAEELLEPSLPESEKTVAVNTILRNGEHLLAIINDILDLSKIEARKLKIEKIACSPVQLVEDVRVLMDERARRKNLEFKARMVGSLPKNILSDPTRIRQILLNLVGNAIKFTDHGSVEIFYGLKQQGGKEQSIFFEVSDTGIGMTHDQIQRLFSPFSQADSSITRKFGGTGLGLTISKRLAEKLGGQITVTSKLGRGSTFRVVMPVEMPTEEDCTSSDLLDSLTKTDNINEDAEKAHYDAILGCNILVAEDAPDNQRLIQAILKKAGAQVSMAGNGKAAVEMVSNAMDNGEPFDLVLMDIQMPILDGYRATAEIRAGGYTSPIVALTAHAMGNENEKTLAAGCDGYLAKPFTRKKLLSIVARFAGGNAEVFASPSNRESGACEEIG
ncbi:MAG: response regulator [Pirellulales bacterium]|nr:response regulator [Pirellulales bacterium]